MQIIKVCQSILEDAGLKGQLWLRPYTILATGPSSGLLEALSDCLSLDALKKRARELEADPTCAVSAAAEQEAEAAAAEGGGAGEAVPESTTSSSSSSSVSASASASSSSSSAASSSGAAGPPGTAGGAAAGATGEGCGKPPLGGRAGGPRCFLKRHFERLYGPCDGRCGGGRWEEEDIANASAAEAAAAAADAAATAAAASANAKAAAVPATQGGGAEQAAGASAASAGSAGSASSARHKGDGSGGGGGGGGAPPLPGSRAYRNERCVLRLSNGFSPLRTSGSQPSPERSQRLSNGSLTAL